MSNPQPGSLETLETLANHIAEEDRRERRRYTGALVIFLFLQIILFSVSTIAQWETWVTMLAHTGNLMYFVASLHFLEKD